VELTKLGATKGRRFSDASKEPCTILHSVWSGDADSQKKKEFRKTERYRPRVPILLQLDSLKQKGDNGQNQIRDKSRKTRCWKGKSTLGKSFERVPDGGTGRRQPYHREPRTVQERSGRKTQSNTKRTNRSPRAKVSFGGVKC